MSLNTQTRRAVEAALTENPGAVLDYIAKDYEVSGAEVISCLPSDQAETIGGDRFEEVMLEISRWGEITFLVHTDDVILEAKGAVPEGKSEGGFYNLYGKPIGGHLKAENCGSISFVSRPLFNTDTHSVQFYNKKGACMFKVYLGRDKERNLIPEQVERFKACRERMK